METINRVWTCHWPCKSQKISSRNVSKSMFWIYECTIDKMNISTISLGGPGNYGLIIFLLVVIIRLIITPLTIKSHMSMAKLKVLNPEIKIIVTQVEVNNRVCPRSGWLIRNSTIINNTRNEYKCLL